MSDNLKVLLVGTGKMAVEYTKVLKDFVNDFIVVGRGETSSENFKNITNKDVISGGITNFLKTASEVPSHAIVAVNVEELANVTMELLKYGVKFILVEKPAGINLSEIKQIEDISSKNNAKVFVAYNRRFYSSVENAKKIINEDEGVSSFHFEFTEWSHIIENLKQSDKVKNHWFFANSTHVVDLAFYLCGKPIEFNPMIKGAGNINWHPSASVFVGSGITENGSLFTYHSNWESAGRWGIEIMTKKHRIILRPLEELRVQNIGSIEIEKLAIDNKLDIDFKPGLYQQVKSFLFDHSSDKLLEVGIHKHMTENVYNKMILK